MSLYRRKKQIFNRNGSVFVGIASLCFLLMSLLTMYTALHYEQQYALHLEKQHRIGKMMIYDAWHAVNQHLKKQQKQVKEKREMLNKQNEQFQKDNQKLTSDKESLEKLFDNLEKERRNWQKDAEKYKQELSESEKQKETILKKYDEIKNNMDKIRETKHALEQELKSLDNPVTLPFKRVRYNMGEVTILQEKEGFTLTSQQRNGYAVTLVFYNTQTKDKDS